MKFKTTQIVELFSGRIGLTEEQAAVRSGALRQVKNRKGLYDIVAPVQFKSGEVIDLVDPDKATLSRLEPLEKKVEPPPPPAVTGDDQSTLNLGGDPGKSHTDE